MKSNKLKKNKITLDKYINLAMYSKKNGYYEKDKVFGRKGDFVTSPYISSIFGEIISIWITHHFTKRNIYNFNIFEIGAGEGLLALDIINTICKFKNLNINFKYFIYEKSKLYKKKQKIKLKGKNIVWVNDLSNFKKKNCIILSNELIDAFPVKHLMKKNNIWYEKCVRYNQEIKNFYLENVKINKDHEIYKKSYYPMNKLNFIEYEPDLENFLKKVSNLVKYCKNNIFITFDYGYNSIEFKNTLQAINKHKKVKIFNDIGNSDITHLVNFYYIKKIFKLNKVSNITYQSQSNFLINGGIKFRLQRILKILKNNESKQKLKMSVKRLISKDQMGLLFKVFTAKI